MGGEAAVSITNPVGPNSSRPSTRFGLALAMVSPSGLGWPIIRIGTVFRVTCATTAPGPDNTTRNKGRCFSFIEFPGRRDAEGALIENSKRHGGRKPAAVLRPHQNH